MDLEKLMRMKVSNLYCWADQEHLSREEVYKVMTEMKDKKTSAGSGGPIGTEYQKNIQVIQKGFPKTPKRIHKCATMACHRPPPRMRRWVIRMKLRRARKKKRITQKEQKQ